MPRTPSVPSYRLHKPSGQAVVTVRGADGRRDVYLGAYNSSESRKEYARIVAELATAAEPAQIVTPRPSTPDATLDEVLLAFWRHAERHYRRGDGTPTHEISEYKQAFKPLRALYGHTPARDFGPLALKAVRGRMVELGWCRKLVNKRVGRLRLVFKWAASEQLVPVGVFHGLATVAGLQRGRTEAHETEPVGPVAVEYVRATLPHLRPVVAAMAELQLLTGMRPGEVCGMRPADLDTSGPVWVYRPPQHKNTHRDKPRAVTVGPRGRAILAAFTPAVPTDYCFSPRRAVEGLLAERAAARVTKVYPTQAERGRAKRVENPMKTPGECYTAASYGQAVTKAIAKANRALIEAAADLEQHIPHWHPNQLRHTHATEVRRRFGLEAAQVALGHSRANVTELYAEKNLALAAQVAAAMG